MTIAAASPRRSAKPGPEPAPAWLFWPFLLLILSSPLPLGANRLFAVSALALGLALLLLAWALAAGRFAAAAPVPLARLWPAALPFAAAIGWAGVQTMAFLPASLDDPAWQAAGHALGQALPGTISLAPSLTLTGIMRLLAYAAVLLLGLELGYRERRAAQILWGVASAGAAYALYGIVVWMGGNAFILWLPKWAYGDSLTSTFVNRNSYATYAGLGLVATLSLLAGALQHRRDWLNRAMPLMAIALTIAAGLLLSRSRGGVAAAAGGIVVMVVLVLASQMRVAGRVAFAAAALALMAVAVVAGGSGLAGRLTPDAIDERSGRVEILKQAMVAVADRPLGGAGLGAFPELFPAYRNEVLGHQIGRIDKAHDLYVELAAELGVPIAGALVLGLGWLTLRTAAAALAVRPGAALAAAGASAVVALHSTVDFSLQIPAVTATWLLLLGAGLAEAERSVLRPHRAPH